MAESRYGPGLSHYGVRMGRPRKSGQERRVVRNIRLDPAVDARVLAFQGQEQFDTYTLALEWLLKRGLRGVEEGRPKRPLVLAEFVTPDLGSGELGGNQGEWGAPPELPCGPK